MFVQISSKLCSTRLHLKNNYQIDIFLEKSEDVPNTTRQQNKNTVSIMSVQVFKNQMPQNSRKMPNVWTRYDFVSTSQQETMQDFETKNISEIGR